MTELNRRYNSYCYSNVAATQDKTVVAKELRAVRFTSMLGRALDGGVTSMEGTTPLVMRREILQVDEKLAKGVAALSWDVMEDLGFRAGALNVQKNATTAINANVITVCLGSRNKHFFCFRCLLLLIGQARRYG